LNFVLHDVLAGGASRSLRTDTQGKTLALALLQMPVERPADLVEMLRPPAAVITLNRPDKRNALSRELIAALSEAVQRAKDDAAVRCLILTGAGPVYCAGMDLAEMAATLERPQDAAAVWDDALRLATLYDLIYTCPKPSVAAVNGPAVAGGAGLVTVC